jgi:hypothetical protein
MSAHGARNIIKILQDKLRPFNALDKLNKEKVAKKKKRK